MSGSATHQTTTSVGAQQLHLVCCSILLVARLATEQMSECEFSEHKNEVHPASRVCSEF